MILKKGKLNLSNSVCFSGYYGHHNTGDDLFCSISAWGARKFWNTNEISFVSQIVPKINIEVKCLFTKTQRYKGQNLIKLAKKILDKPVIVFSGGSIFHTPPCFLSPKSVIFILNKVIPFHVGAIGVSLGPFKNNNDYKKIKSELMNLSFLALRDKRSYEIASEMNLPYEPIEAFDLAALLPDVYGKIKNTKRKHPEVPVLGVSICKYESYVSKSIDAENRRIEKITQTLSHIVNEKKIKLKFLVFNGNRIYGDMEITKSIAEKFRNQVEVDIVLYSNNPQNMWQHIGDCDAVLATRLHAGIFSYFAKTPFVLIEYHKKCSDFLNDIGYPQKYVIGDYDQTPKEVANCLLKMLRGCSNIFSNYATLKEKALRNFVGISGE